MPDNDLDAVGGDPDRVNEIRSAKTLRTSLFDADRPAAYLWTFDAEQAEQAERLAELAGRLHTLGHGIDAAFAHAEVLDAAEGEARLAALGGAPRRPSLTARAGRGGSNGGESGVPCPARGSLESLRVRHEAFTGRFRKGAGKRAPTEFRQPPKPLARSVAYDRSPTRLLYELRPADGGTGFEAWRLTEAVALTLAVRDQLARGLTGAWDDQAERLVVGRTAGPGDMDRRLRILPLPSVRMRHTDSGIRRVLVEVPPDHPIPVADLDWCLAGRELATVEGELTGVVLVRASDTTMLDHYGGGAEATPARVWRTVTPAALPWRAGRTRQRGADRADSEAEAAGAVVEALRHAGVTAAVATVRVQREPFFARGERADAFILAPLRPDRFNVRDLRHVEVTFAAPVRGPLALGDGRWVGLGVMQPVAERAVRRAAGVDGLYAFVLAEGPPFRAGDAEALTRALRRAVMARAAEVLGQRRGIELPTFFTGHTLREEAGRPTAPARGGLHEHLFFALDPGGAGQPRRLLVIAPHRADRRREVLRRTARQLARLAETVEGLDALRAGALGRFALAPAPIPEDDPVLGRARTWVSATDYRPTRHPGRGQAPGAAIVLDIEGEADRRCLPRPKVEVLEALTGPRGGLSARVRLTFAVAMAGPILLGRGSHFGAGLFAREDG